MSIEPQPWSNTAKGGKMIANMTWRKDKGINLYLFVVWITYLRQITSKLDKFLYCVEI